jgi:hypothetical protein
VKEEEPSAERDSEGEGKEKCREEKGDSQLMLPL